MDKHAQANCVDPDQMLQTTHPAILEYIQDEVMLSINPHPYTDPRYTAFANCVDLDQLASEERN